MSRVLIILCERVILGFFACIDSFAAGLGHAKEFGVAQVVIDEDIGGLDAFLGTQREEAGVSRACTHKVNDAGGRSRVGFQAIRFAG